MQEAPYFRPALLAQRAWHTRYWKRKRYIHHHGVGGREAVEKLEEVGATRMEFADSRTMIEWQDQDEFCSKIKAVLNHRDVTSPQPAEEGKKEKTWLGDHWRGGR